MKKILISTGGSGGHVIPGIVLYDHLKSKYEIEIVSDKRGAKFIDKDLYKYEIIDTPKISNNIIFAPFIVILFFATIFKALVFLKKNKINSLISTGGYMSMPFCIAARILNLEIFLLEPNMVIGRSNKFMVRFSKKVFCYYKNILNFPEKYKHKIVIIERLLRKEIYETKNVSSKKSSIFKILVIGGSQGASFFDSEIKEVIKEFSKKQNISILQQVSSEIGSQEIAKTYDNLKINYELFNFDEKIYKKMKSVDLAITRCGASALSDLIYFNIPFVAIPLPDSKDNHQYYNAKYFSDLNCCWLLEQNKIDNKKILDLLLSIIIDKNEYFEKKKNIEKICSQNNWETINKKLIYIINEH